ncbi:hypothetical protein G7Y79_00034g069250 [Physcia stellaris]|nr:hypothetical protein G7Y79_00034g069250 [Physcia stellaris]
MVVLSLGLLSIFHSLAATAPASHPSNPGGTAHLSNLGGTVHLLNNTMCLPPLYLPIYHPSYHACLGAIDTLPASDTIGIFHNFPGPILHHDPFLLPLSRVHHHSDGNCQVVVELEYRYDKERGSWNDVRRAAMSLAVDCKEEAEGREITGGSTAAGVRGGILVRLEKVVIGKGVLVPHSTSDGVGTGPVRIAEKGSSSLA